MYASNKVDKGGQCVRSFVSAAHDKLVDACSSAAPAQRRAPADDEHCTTELAAAARDRLFGSRSKIFMFKAVLGAVCRHGVPLHGCFAFTPRGGAVGESFPKKRLLTCTLRSVGALPRLCARFAGVLRG